MTLLLNLLILVIAAVVVFMVVKYIMSEAGFDPPLQKIVLLIVGLVFLVWLVNVVTGGSLFGNVVVVR